MKIFTLRPSLLFFSFLFSFFFTILEFSGRQGLLALRMESCFVISLEDGVLGILDSVAARPPSRFEFWNGWIRMFDGQMDSWIVRRDFFDLGTWVIHLMSRKMAIQVTKLKLDMKCQSVLSKWFLF